MKAIIPVAGAGVTLRPHTHTQPKPLIPVAGKPILGHIVDSLAGAGVTDFIFVIGYLGEKIKDYIEEVYHGKFNYTFIRQEPRLGIGHAIWLCRNYIQGYEVLIALGDVIIDVDMNALLRSDGSWICVQEAADPRQFGVVALNENGEIKSVVEKPAIPKSNLAMVGLYKIKETQVLLESLQYLIDCQLKTHNEYQLTDALMQMIQRGVHFKAMKVNNWYDCGKKEALIEINRVLLNRQPPQNTPQFRNCVIIPPVHISENCEIRDSIIGPNVAIGEHSRITDSILSNAILGAYSRLESIVLKGSVIGNDSTLVGRYHSVNIGDNTEIDFNS